MKIKWHRGPEALLSKENEQRAKQRIVLPLPTASVNRTASCLPSTPILSSLPSAQSKHASMSIHFAKKEKGTFRGREATENVLSAYKKTSTMQKCYSVESVRWPRGANLNPRLQTQKQS